MSYIEFYKRFIEELNLSYIGPFPPTLELLILPRASYKFVIAEINGIPNINMEQRLEANLFAIDLNNSIADKRNFPSKETLLFIEREIIYFTKELKNDFEKGADAIEKSQLYEQSTLPLYLFTTIFVSGAFGDKPRVSDLTLDNIIEFRWNLPIAIRIKISSNGVQLLESFNEYPPLNR